jgi:hypothetical protein
MNTLVGAATLGIERGLQGIRRSAVEVARSVQGVRAGVPSRDVTHSLVEMKQHDLQARASAKALQAYQDTLGTLLDVHA